MLTNIIKSRRGEALGRPKEDWNLLSNGAIFMLWHVGLRGGIAAVLCMELGGWVDTLEGHRIRSKLQLATFILIGTFLLVFGGTTELLLKKLNIPMGADVPHDKLYKSETLEVTQRSFTWLHDRIMVPFLVGDNEVIKEIQDEHKDTDVRRVLRNASSRLSFASAADPASRSQSAPP